MHSTIVRSALKKIKSSNFQLIPLIKVENNKISIES